MLAKYQVLGVKTFKGDIDGRHYDNTTLLVVLPHSKANENRVGFDTVSVPYGNSENFKKFKDRQYPLSCEIDMEATTAGFVANEVKFEPINNPQAQK